MGSGCIICGSGGPYRGIYRRGGYALVRCECGMVFQDPRPTEAELAQAYYYDEEFTKALWGELRETTLSNARRKLRLLKRANAIAAGARVLDVGASSGAWLEVAAGEGMSAVGVELGAATAATAREHGLDMRTGTLEAALPGLAGERFDLITFWDVLEHLPDPRLELRLARGLLAPGGSVAATFPNVEGLYPRLTYRLFARRTGVWEYPELPVHLYDFAPGTARRLFAGCGLEVERIQTYATPYGFYRSTSLAKERVGPGAKRAALRAAFGALRLVAYPAARLTDQGNAMFVLARPAPAALDAPGAGVESSTGVQQDEAVAAGDLGEARGPGPAQLHR